MAGNFSSNAAAYNSPGQGPGYALVLHQALKGRHNRYAALSGLDAIPTHPQGLALGCYMPQRCC